MDSIRKSFKSSHKYSDLEQRPILRSGSDSDDHHLHGEETVVSVDDNKSQIWRDCRYEFWKDEEGDPDKFDFSGNQRLKNPMPEIVEEDPPSKLIHTFIQKQRAAGAEPSLDMDALELKDLKKSQSPSPLSKVSFAEEHESSSTSDDEDDSVKKQRDSAEVVRNSSFQRQSGLLLRMKTRSRLSDPPPASAPRGDEERRSGMLSPRKSGALKSGCLGKVEEEDDDPFLDEDIPEDFKKVKFGKWAILQWVSFVLILAALVCSLSVRALKRQLVWDLHLWKWEVMVLALICGRLFSGWVIRVAVFFIERSFMLRKRVLYFVYGVRKAVQNSLWLGLVLLTWHYMFHRKVERETDSKTLIYVTKVLICLLVATLVWLVKSILLKVLASSFHVSTYFERIQESLFKQYVIETLSGPPLVEIRHYREEEAQVFSEVQNLQKAGCKIPNDLKAAALKSRSFGRAIGGSGNGLGGNNRKSTQLGVGRSIGRSGPISKKEVSKQLNVISINHLHKLNQKNVSAWNMKRLMRIVRYGTLTTLDEQLGSEYGEDESAKEIRSEFQAKVAAKKIFNNVAKPGSKHIYLADLMRFMMEDEAQKTMGLFEADENCRVSRRSLKNWVVNAFKERRALSLTLNDTKTAVNKLHQMANVVVAIIVISLSLLILNIATTHFFVFLSSQLLLTVFVFGNTLKTIFEAIIFLFAMHPFDVGDRCEINGVQMVVEEMNILTTVFLRFDNQKITYPNTALAALPIGNFYRSPDMGDSIDFCIHVSTPLEKIAIMKERIIGFMESKKDHWYPDPSVVLRDVDDMNRLKISIWMRHRINFQDMGVKWERRELVMKEMMRVLRELDIEYRMLPLDVNVREITAPSSNRLPSTWNTCS